MPDFKKLRVWHEAYQLALRAAEIASRVARRKPAWAKQLERAADAVPAAIAEGRGRATDADFAHFVTMAIGSVTEVENHIQRGYDGGMIQQPEYEELTARSIQIRRMLIGLRKTLRGQPRPSTDSPSPSPSPIPSPSPSPQLASAPGLCPMPNAALVSPKPKLRARAQAQAE
jgi:four helix bundle protein